jgi:hypothetical protein
MFQIGGNTFYDRKTKIKMKNLEFERSRIGIIVEFRGIPRGFPNQSVIYQSDQKGMTETNAHSNG